MNKLLIFFILIVAACAGSSAFSPEQIEAQQLAIEATGSLCVLGSGSVSCGATSKSAYDRALRELKGIRATYQDVSSIDASPSWVLDELLIGFDSDGERAVREGEYSAWNELNTKYGSPKIDIGAGYVLLQFSNVYNIPLVAAEYAKLSHVDYAEPNNVGGGGDDICLSIDGETYFYVFQTGTDDCPAGCIYKTYWGFAVNAQGVTIQVFKGEDTLPSIKWINRCKNWLS